MKDRRARFLLLDPSMKQDQGDEAVRGAILIYAVYRVLTYHRYNKQCSSDALRLMLRQAAREGAMDNECAMSAVDQWWPRNCQLRHCAHDPPLDVPIHSSLLME